MSFQVYDLLNNKAQLRVLEDERQQVQVVGLQEVGVSAAEDVIKIIETGSACRYIAMLSSSADPKANLGFNSVTRGSRD